MSSDTSGGNRRIRRQVEIVGEIHLDAVPLANRDRRQDVQVAIEHAAGRGGETGPDALAERLAEQGGVDAGLCAELGQARERADGERRAEDLQVVAVDAVLEAGLADLIEALEAIEAVGLAIGITSR